MTTQNANAPATEFDASGAIAPMGDVANQGIENAAVTDLARVDGPDNMPTHPVTAADPEGDGLDAGQTTANVHGDILAI